MAASAWLVPSVSAQVTWNGVVSASWQNGTNWSSGSVPTAAQVAVFSGTPTANQPNNGTSGQTAAGLSFATSGWTISGSTLAIGGLGISLQATNGSVNVVGIRATTNQTWDINTGATLTAANLWSNDGTNRSTITKTGGGTMVVSGNSTAFPEIAALNLNGGVLSVSTVTAIAQTATNAVGLTFDGGTFQLTSATGTMALGRFTNFVVNSGGATFENGAGSLLNVNVALSGAGGLTKSGLGTLSLGGTNNYTGDTTVNNGTITLATNGSLRFFIGGNGTNNSLKGVGAALIDGKFAFDLSGASTVVGHSWTIVANTLTNTYGTNFLVEGFNGAAGLWTNTTNGVSYVFAQSNSVLTVVSATTNNYASWASYWQSVDPGFTNTAGTDDPDGDGFDNNKEFAFDGNPTVGTPALLTATRAGTNAVCTFVARKNPPGGVAYQVHATTNLTTGPWTNSPVVVSNSADQSGLNIPADYERRQFTVPASGDEFFRIQAVVNP